MTSCQSVSSSIWVDLLVIASFLGALIFVVGYAYLTRGAWRRTVMGKHVMFFMVVITLVSSLAVASVFFGTDWPHRNVIRGVSWGLVAACVWHRVWLLYSVQHRLDGAAVPTDNR